jgi:hypothetical protein
LLERSNKNCKKNLDKGTRWFQKLSGVFVCRIKGYFIGYFFLFCRERSPPANLDFKKIQIGGKEYGG